MRFILLGGFLIVMPALVVVLYFWGSFMMFPALGSLFIAALPFVAFTALFRRLGSEGDGAGH